VEGTEASYRALAKRGSPDLPEVGVEWVSSYEAVKVDTPTGKIEKNQYTVENKNQILINHDGVVLPLKNKTELFENGILKTEGEQEIIKIKNSIPKQ